MKKRPPPPPRAVALQAKVPTVKSANLPAVQHTAYRDFDDWKEAAEHVLGFTDRHLLYLMLAWRDEPAIPKFLDDLKRTIEEMRHVEQAWRKFDAGWEFHNREELYEKCPESRDLLNCYSGHILTRRHVAEQLANAVAGINQKPQSGNAYVKCLIEEVLVAKPSAPALESACREIRRTMTFLPSAAEVLEILRKHMEHWSELQEIDSIEQWRERLDNAVNRVQAKLTEQASKAKEGEQST